MSIRRPALWLPSWAQGFAGPDRLPPANPNLWTGLVYCGQPTLGPTGLTLFDVSGRGNDGTSITPTWGTAEVGPVLTFDGATDRVQIGKIPGTSNRGTVVAFANAIDGASGDMAILGDLSNQNANNWRVRPNLTRQLMGFSDGTTVPLNWGGVVVGWRLWSWRWEGSAVTFGRDIEFASNDLGGAGTVDWSIIDSIGDAGNFEWKGDLAFLAAWDRILADSEIQTLLDPHAIVRPMRQLWVRGADLSSSSSSSGVEVSSSSSSGVEESSSSSSGVPESSSSSSGAEPSSSSSGVEVSSSSSSGIEPSSSSGAEILATPPYQYIGNTFHTGQVAGQIIVAGSVVGEIYATGA